MGPILHCKRRGLNRRMERGRGRDHFKIIPSSIKRSQSRTGWKKSRSTVVKDEQVFEIDERS